MRRVETVRQEIADLLGASSKEIAFTKNTSDGLNIAANAMPLEHGDEVLLLSGDHPNNAYVWLNLRSKGVVVKFVVIEDNEIADASTFSPYITANTRVISLSHVSFHAGQRHDIASIGKLCADKGLYLVVDAMQSVGVVPLNVMELGVSVLAAGCHKGLLVPQGLGFMYVKGSLQELQPAYVGMSSMERPPYDYIATPDDTKLKFDACRFESGNYNLPHIHALAASLSLINEWNPSHIQEHVLVLGDLLIKGLNELGIDLVGPWERSKRLHIYVLALPVAASLDYFGTTNVRLSPERGGIRISLAAFNTAGDIHKLIQHLQRLMKSIGHA
jgi:selenocysteine lyase/cysteine desulfurase